MSEDAHEELDKLLDEVQIKHFEMAGMVGEYRTMLMKLQSEPEPESLRLARGLPGGRYHIATKYVEEQWKRIQNLLDDLYGEKSG
jgi:hypothetical protein